MIRRVDKLADLGASVVAFSGGEPMLHPQLDDIIRQIRRRGMLAGLITNGYLLSPKRIQALNDAGLDFLQISIDNLEPDEVSKKSLRLLDKKLQWLADARRVRREHQLGRRRRREVSAGREGHQPARATNSASRRRSASSTTVTACSNRSAAPSARCSTK